MPMTSTRLISDDYERDLARLQGVWEQVRLEADGVVDPPDEHGAPGALTIIAGTHFSVRTVDGELLLEGSFILDAATRPTSVTWIDAIGATRANSCPPAIRWKATGSSSSRVTRVRRDRSSSAPPLARPCAASSVIADAGPTALPASALSDL